MKKRSVASIPSKIKVGQAGIELLVEQGQFLGLGKITVHGTPLRSATVPLQPEIMTPDGIRYDSFRLDAVRSTGDEVVLVTTAFGRQGLFGEYRDEYDSLLAWLRTDCGPFADIVEWRLRPTGCTISRLP